MADVQLQTKSETKHRRKRLVARVDLTPMVDLAFLLITFFMLTIKLQEDHAMLLKMPDNSDTTNVPNSALLTFILDTRDIIWYYPGDDYLALQQTNYTSKGLRELIYSTQKEVRQKSNNKRELICIIKMTDRANYKNMVDIFDEMEITNVYSYAMQDLREEENLAIKQQL